MYVMAKCTQCEVEFRIDSSEVTADCSHCDNEFSVSEAINNYQGIDKGRVFITEDDEEYILKLIEKHEFTPPNWNNISSVKKFEKNIEKQENKALKKANKMMKKDPAIAEIAFELSIELGKIASYCDDIYWYLSEKADEEDE